MSGNQQNGTDQVEIRLNTIEEAVEDFKNGKIIIVVDDEDVGKYDFKEVTGTYVLIDKYIGNSRSTGKLIYKSSERINNFIFNPIEIEVASDLNSEFKVYLTKDEDGLLVESLSYRKYRIFNSQEGKNKFCGYIYKVRIVKWKR